MSRQGATADTATKLLKALAGMKPAHDYRVHGGHALVALLKDDYLKGLHEMVRQHLVFDTYQIVYLGAKFEEFVGMVGDAIATDTTKYIWTTVNINGRTDVMRARFFTGDNDRDATAFVTITDGSATTDAVHGRLHGECDAGDVVTVGGVKYAGICNTLEHLVGAVSLAKGDRLTMWATRLRVLLHAVAHDGVIQKAVKLETLPVMARIKALGPLTGMHPIGGPNALSSRASRADILAGSREVAAAVKKGPSSGRTLKSMTASKRAPTLKSMSASKRAPSAAAAPAKKAPKAKAKAASATK